jgi:single-stranded DNA-binding protein
VSIDVAFHGFLAADAEPRTSQAGKPWVRMRVGVGKDDVQWVSIAVFGRAAEIAAELKKSDRCYIEGTIRLDTWRGTDGVERHGLSVAAFRCERTHNIGKNKPKRENGKRPKVSRSNAAATDGGGFYSDEIPFAPEVR